MKKFLLLIAVLFQGSFLTAEGQDKDPLDSIKISQRKEFDLFFSGIRLEHNRFTDSINREFSASLRKMWESFTLSEGKKPDTNPKPKKIPRLTQSIERMKSREVGVIPSGEQALAEIPAGPVPQGLLRTSYDTTLYAPGNRRSYIDFYGTTVGFSYDTSLKMRLPREIHNYIIADFWDKMNAASSDDLIRQLNFIKEQRTLNDWAFYMLVKKAVEQISTDSNYSRLLTWFILLKSGYMVRVGYDTNTVLLLFPSLTPLYDIKFFFSNDVKFYVPECHIKTIFTYSVDYPGAIKRLDMNIYTPMKLGEQYKEKQVSFSYDGKEYQFPISYNVNAVNFYKDYPLCDIKVNFDAVPSPKFRESILNSFAPALQDLPDLEKANFLLSFVQNAFEYKTDQEQFGKEKFDFPEEVFFYPYSDCDDRAVLFSYLVVNLTGLDVIGVVYPGHVATAISFLQEVEGDFILFNGNKYIIADPTYKNAPVGLTMPGKENSSATVIGLFNRGRQLEEISSAWEKVKSGGGFPGDNQMNAVRDGDGNIYLTGYYRGSLNLGEMFFPGQDSSENPFIAKYNKAGNLMWAKRGTDKAIGRGYNINLDREGNLFVTGTFRDLMAMAPSTLYFQKEKPVFL